MSVGDIGVQGGSLFVEVAPSSIKQKIQSRLLILEETASSLAEKMGLSRMRVASLLDVGVRKTHLKTYERVADILGVPLTFVCELESWDGLLAPVPQWLLEAKAQEKRTSEKLMKKELERIERARTKKRKKTIRKIVKRESAVKRDEQ